MESERILQFFENKSILITGATGFIAKMLVEKLLRVQPNVKKLYLLIRASDNHSASQRMHTEILEKDLFRVLREKWDTNFGSLISEKVIAVSGDISCENIGVNDVQLRERLWKEIDIVINSAATTSFDARYDFALGTNTLGALHLLSFAKKCINIKMLVHISTAYVCGEREGHIREDAIFYTGKTIKAATPKLDFKAEEKLVAEKLNELCAQDASEGKITLIMKDFGIKRSKLHGWPNTYAFTKAMGEICLRQSKEMLPLIIIRPTMVTGSYKEPFPGWIEGLRTVDAVIAGYAKGKIKCFLANPKLILDLIPGDMVINSIMVAMAVNANQSSEIIYHVGSSLRNPIYFSNIVNFTFQYFAKNPLMDKKGKLVKLGKPGVLFRDMATLKAYMAIQFMLPLKILKLLNIASCQNFKDVYQNNDRKLKQSMRLIELYKPYVLLKLIFEDRNTEKLRQTVSRKNCRDMEAFNFDPKLIDWENYMINTHIPGLVKYVMK